MRDDRISLTDPLTPAQPGGYSVVIVTLDAHSAGPCARIAPRLQGDFPGLTLTVLAAAEWAGDPAALARARAAIEGADMILANLLFIEEHVQAVLPSLIAMRPHVDALVGIIADPAIVRLTKMGDLDMAQPASGVAAFLKKLRGSKEPGAASGEKQMTMLRRLPKILKFIPGKAQDLRAWFLSMQYWLGGSDDNIEQLIRFLIGRYARYITIFRHLEAHPEQRFHPIFKWFRQWCNDEFSHGEAFALLMRTDPKITEGWQARLWIRFFLVAVYSTMWVRDHARPEFHKALGVDIDWYDQEVYRKTSAIARQVFPVEVDIDHPRWIPGLRRMDAAMRDMEKAAKKGGLGGWIAHKAASARAMAAFAGLYLIPVKGNRPPASVRLEPSY